MMYKKHLFALGLATVLFACSEDEDKIQNVSSPIQQKTATSTENMLVENTGFNVVVNPSRIAPLTAAINFQTRSASQVSIEVLGAIPVSKTFSEIGTNHSVPVLGLYGNTANKVVITLNSDFNYASDTLIIQTDSINPYLPDVVVSIANTGLMEPGMNLSTLSISDGTDFQPYPMMYDHNGDIRWYLELEGIHTGFVSPMERLDNGYLLFETGPNIVEYDMMGNKMKDLMLPTGYHGHHDVIKLSNGNYMVAVDKAGTNIMYNGVSRNTVEDIMIEINGNTGAVIEEWDLREVLDVSRESLTNSDLTYAVDWFHMNAINICPNPDEFVTSGRNQGLVKMGRNNELKWIMAPHEGWGNAGFDGLGSSTKPHLLTAVNGAGVPYDSLVQYGRQSAPDFDWTWGQHAPIYLPNGNLLVFDNGFARNFQNNAPYSRLVEYKIDDANKTVQQIWSYGESRGAETFSPIISDVDYLEKTGNVLFCPGIMFGANPNSKIIELTRPGGVVVFEGTLTFKNARGSGQQGFGQFDLSYRAERLTLYP